MANFRLLCSPDNSRHQAIKKNEKRGVGHETSSKKNNKSSISSRGLTPVVAS